MPYNTTADVPTYVPKAKKKQWLEVFNSAWAKAKSEGKTKQECEQSAFAQANGVAGPNSKKISDTISDSKSFQDFIERQVSGDEFYCGWGK